MTTTLRAWLRDFGLVGAASGLLAPLPVYFLGPRAVVPVSYSVLAALGGGATGLLLGWLSARWFAGRGRFLRRIALIPLGLAAGALWGGAAGALASLALAGRPALLTVGLSAAVGGIAGAFQLGWFWLAYAVRRVNGRRTWPVVLLATGLAGGLGWAATATVIVLSLALGA